MAEEIKPESQENKPINPSDQLFEKMSSVEPARDVEIPEDEGESGGGDGGHETLDERIDYSPKKSDVQVVVEKLSPDLKVNYLNVMQVARIFPDVFDALFWANVKSVMRREGLSLIEAIDYVTTSLSIGIDGEYRIELVKIMGRASEVEETKAKNTMGLG